MKPAYLAYHDEQWGVPVYEDRPIFEYLPLESAQAGLSRTQSKRRFRQFEHQPVNA